MSIPNPEPLENGFVLVFQQPADKSLVRAVVKDASGNITARGSVVPLRQIGKTRFEAVSEHMSANATVKCCMCSAEFPASKAYISQANPGKKFCSIACLGQFENPPDDPEEEDLFEDDDDPIGGFDEDEELL